MKDIDLILFDLDGTLTDPGEGITNSVRYALTKYGIDVPDRTALYPFIGPPLIHAFRDFYGFSDAQARQAVVYYREYFAEQGIFENRVYDGVPAMLARLRDAGFTLALATSKPEPFACRILSHFSLDGYFQVIAGADMTEARTAKADVIARALTMTGIPAGRALMVGDREFDVKGAAQFGMDTIGVLYGYGSREELTAAGARELADTPARLVQIILR